jgi:curved DNA-binding protein CbpA
VTRRRPRACAANPAADPFGVLGLTASPGLTDEEVHAAWRRIASGSHPDREDGGDPERFAAAAAAYTTLRTASGRGEALADRGPVRRPARAPRWLRSGISRLSGLSPAAVGTLAGRVARGRPYRLALRIAAAAAAGTAAVLAAGPHPAAPALVTGVATWLILTARRDLAPPDG